MIIDCDTSRFVWEVIDNNEYSYLFKNLVVMDVGCDWGSFSLWMNDLARKIYAIDISEENIKRLKTNIQTNQLTKIVPYHCAIGGKTKERYYDLDAKPGNGSSKITESGFKTIQMYTVNDFMKREGIDYVDVLKLDIEGCEYETLEAPDFPREKISTIVGEFHGEKSERQKKIEDILHLLGYRTTIDKRHFLGRRI